MTAQADSGQSRAIEGLRRVVKRVLAFDEIGVLAALLIIGLLLSLTTDSFLTTSNLLQVARQASYYGIMAVGMVFALSMGDVDLSVGSILMFVAIITAILLRAAIPLPVAVVLGLTAGALCGFINGLLSVTLRIPTIIVTLGTMSIYRGLALVFSNAKPISNFPKNNLFFKLGGSTIMGIPTSVVVMIVVAVLGYILFSRAAFGMRVMAIGSNKQAAQFAGVRIVRHRLLVMTLVGLCAGIAGVMALGFLQTADPSTGPGMELYVIASAIIGGTALTGGSGSIPGAILGALIIAMIRNGLVLLGFSAYWGIVATGVVIILAVALDRFVKRK